MKSLLNALVYCLNIPIRIVLALLVANILAGPLKELYPIISQLVKEGGDLGLSGILETQAQSVCDAYTQSFDLDPVAVKEEWCRITGKLK